jgi:hypothetical protein
MAQKLVRSDRVQSQRFIKAAQELGCDEDPAHFDEILRILGFVNYATPFLSPRPSKASERERWATV